MNLTNIEWNPELGILKGLTGNFAIEQKDRPRFVRR